MLDWPRTVAEVLPVKPLIWSVLLVIPVGAFGAEIYRSVGENGEVVYSDLPGTTGEGERVTVNVPAPGRSAGACKVPSDEPELARPADRLVAPGHRELAEDAPDVRLDGVDGDEHR